VSTPATDAQHPALAQDAELLNAVMDRYADLLAWVHVNLDVVLGPEDKAELCRQTARFHACSEAARDRFGDLYGPDRPMSDLSVTNPETEEAHRG